MKFTKETFRRTARTFIQTVFSYIVANIILVDFTADVETVKKVIFGLITSAFASGLAVVMNLERKEDEIDG